MTEIAILSDARALPAGIPSWVQLLPAGPRFSGVDGRGPYLVSDMAALGHESMVAANGRLPIDENHATDLAAPRGQAAPARGWIVELAARADGLFGRVEWSDAGRQLLADHAYRWLSPVFAHRPDGTITHVLRAALVNNPNLHGMLALNSPQPRTLTVVQVDVATRLSISPDAMLQTLARDST
jgi:phage I-like protein